MRRDAQVRTPFVIVVQHDRNFMRQVDVRPIVSAMCRHRAWLKYAGLPTGTTIKHAQQCLSRYALRLEHVPTDEGLKLMPLIQWYDSTHVCSTAHYRQFVYGAQGGGNLVKKGGFVEDKLGQKQLSDVRAGGMSAHAPYGTFIVEDGSEEIATSHLDGHDRMNFKKFRWARPSVQASAEIGRSPGRETTKDSEAPA